MPDARYYIRQAKILLSISAGTPDPVLSNRFRGVAEDYLARALKLKMDPRLQAKSPSPALIPEPQAANAVPIRLAAARPSPDTAAALLPSALDR